MRCLFVCVCQLLPALSSAEVLAIEPPKTSQTSQGCRPQSSPQDISGWGATGLFCITILHSNLTPTPQSQRLMSTSWYILNWASWAFGLSSLTRKQSPRDKPGHKDSENEETASETAVSWISSWIFSCADGECLAFLNKSYMKRLRRSQRQLGIRHGELAKNSGQTYQEKLRNMKKVKKKKLI